MNKYLLLFAAMLMAVVLPARHGSSIPDIASGIENLAREKPDNGRDSTGQTHAIQLRDILKPDGTPDLSKGLKGSINLAGFQMRTRPDGAPYFVEESPATLSPDDNWQAFGGGCGVGGDVYAVAVIGNDLYVGGDLGTAGGVFATGLAKWNGTDWSDVGGSMNSTVYALTVLGSDLYAGGYFTTAGGVPANRIAKWNGTNWSALSSGINNTVNALTVIGGDLYAGGYFSTAGGTAASNIAKWDGTSWSALGSGMNDWVYALTVTGDNLYVGGQFSTAGGKLSTNIAQWGCTQVTYYPDADGDGYGAGTGQSLCANPGAGYTIQDGDCNDNDDAIKPGASETCDQLDNDCNGLIDDVSGNTSGAWSSGGVGGPGGSASFPPCFATSNDVFTLQATGFSTSSSDNLNMVHQTLCGNGEIIAHVVSVSSGGWAGITLRETLDPGSKKVALKTQLTNNLRREIRTMTNGAVTSLNFNRPNHTWLRLVRSGSNFTGYTSVDRLNWSFAFATTITMNGCIYAGLVAESINSTTTVTAAFDNVVITGGTAPLAGAPQHGATLYEEHQTIDVQLFPNPTSGALNLKIGTPALYGENLQISIFSTLGAALWSSKIESADHIQSLSSMPELPDGVYWIQVQAPGYVPAISRVVIQQGSK